MQASRYIMVQAIVNENKELIPIWNSGISFVDDETYGQYLRLKNDHKHYSPVECVYDLVTEKLSMGIEIDIYPKDEDLQYKIAEQVYYEGPRSYRHLEDRVIIDIVFEDYDFSIHKGIHVVDEVYLDPDMVIDPKAFYCVRRWKPYYILDTLVKVQWEHNLYKKTKSE